MVEFVNLSPIEVLVSWVDPSGTLKRVAQLQKGQAHLEQTAPGAEFRLHSGKQHSDVKEASVKIQGEGRVAIELLEDASVRSFQAKPKWEEIEAARNRPTVGGQNAPASVKGSNDLMVSKAHGTCVEPVRSNIRWGSDQKLADKISCWNRHGAEPPGYWQQTTFLQEAAKSKEEVTFYDTVTGKPLFVAPRGRSWDEFLEESKHHGWPSFRDEELVTENVRVLANGEAVSADGTHLGHNIPDDTGNRYCINLVSVAGQAAKDEL